MPEKLFKVVISGLSGRFPECDDVDTFKEKLFRGDEFITVDDRKWPVGFKHKRTSEANAFIQLRGLGEKLVPDATGKFLSIANFDQTVFKVNQTFARSSDITNRKILEPAFEAVVDAGINPYSLDGSNVSVFMSAGINESDYNAYSPNIPSQILGLIGCNKTMMSNRVSYALNLKGPSYTTHVDPHGGLNSLMMGYRYISEGLVDAAIVGVASSIIDPRISLLYHTYGVLCPDGVTRPFDEWADGYARSEGVVCFYLQRVEDAKRSYGEIAFCDQRYLGHDLSNFINSGENYLKICLQQLLLEAEGESTSESSNIAFLEMSACGHKALDKIESNVVAQLVAKDRNEPLLVGSIKSNIGHVEAAAGLMAVLKVLLMLDSGVVVPNRHFQKPNDDIEALKTDQLEVVTDEKRSLPGNTVAVNSVSLFGTVGLAIIKQHEKEPVSRAKTHNEPFPRLMLICGRQENDLRAKISQIEKSPFNAEFISLTNDAFRQHMPLHTYRGYTVLPSPFRAINSVKERGDPYRSVWFIFSGMGSQWIGMGKDLLKLPLFAETVAKCDRVLRQKNVDIYHILTSDDTTIFDNIMNAFVGIITVQIGLYEVIKALGIKADGIIGHSVGENACAYADGCLSLEQAVLASWARGMASNEVETINGMMAAVGKGYAEMKDILPEDIQVACHNSADSCTLTGPAKSVQSYVQELKGQGVFARAVNVANIAYHSKYIAPIAPRLLDRLEQVIKEPKQRSSRWISTSVSESRWDSPLARCCSAEYLTNNLLSPVLFEEGCKHIPENAICIEFAPHGLLQAILKRSLPESCANIPLTRRGKVEDNLNFLLSSIGMLYTAGLDLDVNNIFPAAEYPVPRGTPHISPYCTWYHQDNSALYQVHSHQEEDLTMASELIPVCVRYDSDCAYLKDHRVDDNFTIPQSFFLFLTWKMFLSESPPDTLASSTVVLEGVKIHQNLVFRSALDIKYASVMVQYGSGNFQVMLQDSEDSKDVKVILTGRIRLVSENFAHRLPQLTTPMEKSISKNQFYNILEHCGYNLGEEFSLVKGIQSHGSQYKGEIMWNGNWVTFLDALMKVQMFANNNENVKDVVPTCIQRLEIPASQHQSLEQGAVLPYSLDVNTKELLCSGVLMHASKYKTLPKPEAHLSPFRFVPYPNPRCQDVLEFLHLCLQIAVENLVMSKYRNGTNGLQVFDMTGKYWRAIKQITKEQNILKTVMMMDALEKRKANGLLANVLIITDNVERLSEIGTAVKNVFILLISPSTLHGQQKYEQYFTKLVQQSFSTNEFTLLKKKEQDPAREGHNLGVKKKNGINGKVASSSLFSKNLNVEDVSRLINVKTDHLDERCLYVMDEGVSNEKLDQCMQKQSELGLCVSVLKHGELGSYRDLTHESNESCTIGPILKHTKLVSRIRAGAKRVNYVCFDEIEDIPTSEQSVGFSYVAALGTSAQGMGLATTSPTGIPQYDSHLQWTVPTNCSSEEAATMLFFYAQAYKLLVLIPSMRSNYLRNVMINVGSNYSLAEAFIVLSLYKNLEVFVIVDSDEDTLLFKHRFPKIHHDHVFSSKSLSYYIQLKMRAVKVDLIVNCLSGIDHVETSLKCLATEGMYVEVGTNNSFESNDIGLEPFLRSISFCVTPKRVSDLLQQSVETRRAMQKFIENCLNEGVIAPLKFDSEYVSPIEWSSKSMRMMRCNLEEEMNNGNVATIMYDEEHSYLILATGLEDSSVLELIEWLVGQGACKFIVALEKFGELSRTEYRINRILTRANVHIQFTCASKFDDRREAGCFLEQIEKHGPLEAIFYLSIKSAGNKISNLNELVSPDVYFVGLSSAGLKEFEQRRAKGSPAIILHTDEPKNVRNALPRLNELLAQNDNNNTEILYHVTIPEIRNGHSKKIMNHLTFRDYLPHNIEVLSSIGEQETMEPTFIEMSSLSRRYVHCKGVFPIFALPAIHSLTLEPLFKRIQYPVFSATATSTNSIKEVAHKLYSSLKNIQPTGPITMISELWTLPLALELRSYAQRDGRRYRICILEGIPKVWSDRFKQLQSIGSEKFDAVCADEIFYFIEKTKKHHTQKFVPFEQNVQMLAESATGDLKTVKNVVRAAKKINRIVTEVSRAQFPDEMLEHVIWFEMCRPNDKTLKLSVTSEVIVVNEPTYRGLLNNTEVARAINKHAEFSWWEYSKPENGQR